MFGVGSGKLQKLQFRAVFFLQAGGGCRFANWEEFVESGVSS